MKNLTAYQTNLYRQMKENRIKYAEQLEIAKKYNRTKVILFLEKYIAKLDEMIKGYE